MNYFQSTKKESGGVQPTITVFWTNSDLTVPLAGFSENVDITQHDNIRVKWRTSATSPSGIQEVILPTNMIGPLNSFRSGISSTTPNTGTWSRYLQSDGQILTITDVYLNGNSSTANNNSQLITELAFIDGITL